jgi:hypothetical protein
MFTAKIAADFFCLARAEIAPDGLATADLLCEASI